MIDFKEKIAKILADATNLNEKELSKELSNIIIALAKIK